MKKEIIPLTKEEEKIHCKQKRCYMCKKRFSTDDNNKEYHKVRDHCHYTGKYRGAAHDTCNLRYKIRKEIPVVFHNGSKNLKDNLNVWEKIQKNILLSQYQLKRTRQW